MEAIETNEALLPVYLIEGEDQLKRKLVLKRLKSRIADGGDISFNFDSFSGDGASGDAIIAACNTLPFIAPARLVLVTEADKLKKTDSDALAAYLEAPAATAVLALVADKIAQNSRLYKAVKCFGEKAFVSCLLQRRYELVHMVRQIAKGLMLDMSEGAAALLIDLVGEDTMRLDNELKKLALSHPGRDPLSEDELRTLVSRSAEAKPWEFVDAFSARNINKCMACLIAMESVSAHALLAMCVTRLRGLICARALYERGRPGELAAVLKLPDWRVKNHQRWSQAFTKEELRRALVTARDLEQAMKSGADPDNAFLEWFLGCIKTPKRRT